MKRRQFLQLGALLTLAAPAGSWTEQTAQAAANTEPFVQPPLPYAMDALEPFLTGEQMSYHYGKHHAGYYTNLNKLLQGKEEAKLTLEEIVLKAEGTIFNNAAQAWNHAFFWQAMAPAGKRGQPSVKLQDAIKRDFGSIDKLKVQWVAQATALFGSGWAWLCADKDEKLSLLMTSNADCPQKHGLKPVLVVDVWEHAYYVDYRNDRAKYLNAFLEYINWNFANENY